MIDRERAARLRTLVGRLLFGDRVGVAVFLAGLCLFVALWRTAFFINDSYTIANGLYAVAHGDISMTVAEYGNLRSPGTNFYDNRIYARNYGVIVLSLPVLYALQALSAVADLRVALIGIWVLLVFALCVNVGRTRNERRRYTIGGGLLAIGLFAINVALATPLDPIPSHLMALQVVHMLAAAFVGTLAYRLVAVRDNRRVGIAAAVLVVSGTPLAFWASVPKRHVVTAAIALGVALSLAISRDGDHEWALEARALGYLQVALLAWIHAPEALILCVVFVVVDIATAPSNDRRTVGLLGAVFLIGLLPMFVTNLLIAGDPFTVPRMLRSVNPGADLSLSGESGSGSGVGGGTSGSDGRSGGFELPGFVLFALSVLQAATDPLVRLTGLLHDGVETLLTRHMDAYHALVRRGYVERLAAESNDSTAANLSILESAPVLAAVVAAVPAAVHTTRSAIRREIRSPAPSDLFLAVFVLVVTLVYIGTLPLPAQVTARYLYPITPALVCLLVGLTPVGRAIERHWLLLYGSLAGGVLIGGQLVLVALVVLRVGRAEAFQFHALLGIVAAALVGVWCLLGWATDRLDRYGAVLLGLAAATTTVFVCFAAVEYFGLGGAHALPMVRVLSDLVPLR